MNRTPHRWLTLSGLCLTGAYRVVATGITVEAFRTYSGYSSFFDVRVVSAGYRIVMGIIVLPLTWLTHRG